MSHIFAVKIRVFKHASHKIHLTYVRVNSSREHHPPGANPRAYPGHLKKMFKCPALRAIFVGKCPAPHSYYDGQVPGPPVHPFNTGIQNY